MIKVSLIIVFLCFGITGFSAEKKQSGLCEDMATFSCAPGVHDDGTGTSRNTPDGNKSGQEEVLAELKSKIAKKMETITNNPNNTYFRDLAVKAFGLTDAPQCNSDTKANVKKCNDSAAAGLSQMMAKKLHSSSMDYTTTSDFESLSLLSNNHLFEDALAEMKSSIGEKIERPTLDKKIATQIFSRVQELLIKKISTLDIADEAKAKMTAKIRGIEFKGTNCTEDGANGIAKSFEPNAFYDPQKNIFKICQGILVESDSIFPIVTIITHELAHSIDPCQIKTLDLNKDKKFSSVKTLDESYPIKGLLQCLRTSKSIEALPKPIAPTLGMGMMVPTGSVAGGGPSGASLPTAAPPAPSIDSCGTDQITESVGDWFGAEITADYASQFHKNLSQEQWQIGVSNMFRPICNKKQKTTMAEIGYGYAQQDPHPVVTDRINAVILQNPRLREKMGCDKSHSKYVYCDPTKPEQMLELAEQDRLKKAAALSAIPAASSSPYNGNPYGLPTTDPNRSSRATGAQ